MASTSYLRSAPTGPHACSCTCQERNATQGSLPLAPAAALSPSSSPKTGNPGTGLLPPLVNMFGPEIFPKIFGGGPGRSPPMPVNFRHIKWAPRRSGEAWGSILLVRGCPRVDENSGAQGNPLPEARSIRNKRATLSQGFFLRWRRIKVPCP